jgi:hypothetical protein
MFALPEYNDELDTIEQYWHFDRLCQDLADYQVPAKSLSPAQQQLLKDFLLGYTPREIERKTNRAGMRASRSESLYPLIKALVGSITAESIRPNSPRILMLLERMGYRKALMSPQTANDKNRRLPQFADSQLTSQQLETYGALSDGLA